MLRKTNSPAYIMVRNKLEAKVLFFRPNKLRNRKHSGLNGYMF